MNVSNAITQAENEKIITQPPSVEDSIDLREEFGQQPASLMSFSRKPDDDLEKLISLVDMDTNLKKVRGNVWFDQTPHPFSTFFPQRCKFYLSYYTRKGDLILDPYGKGGISKWSLHGFNDRMNCNNVFADKRLFKEDKKSY